MNPFIPSWLDELNLRPVTFRVYCHLWRRGTTHSSTKTIAEICRIKRDTVFQILKELEEAGLLQRTARAGETSLILPIPPSEVTPKEGIPTETGLDLPPQTGLHLPRLGGHKGNPIKVIPKKVTSAYELPFPSQEFLATWNSWLQYRKEKKKPLTPSTIEKQLKKLAPLGEQTAIRWINCAIEKGWQGLYPPPQDKPTIQNRPTNDTTRKLPNGLAERPFD